MDNTNFNKKKLFLGFVVIFITLGCSLFTPSENTTPIVTETLTPQVEISPEVTASETSPGGNAASVDNIEIHYFYTEQLITVLYPLYGKTLDDFIVATITNTNQVPVKVIVSSEIQGYTDKATDTITVDPSESVEIRQNPTLIPSVIDQLNTEKTAQVHVRVTYLDKGEEKVITDNTDDTTVYSRRDFPWSIKGFTQKEIFDLLGAMVTPNDPAVEGLLRTAANYTKSGIMWGGYDDESDASGGVWDRLQSIWKAEEENKITYINTTVSFAPGSVQRIRLPYEVLEQKSGNCIETSLLYASAAEAISLEPAIILIPGHAYVGVRTDDVNSQYYFIETTTIGRLNFSDAVDYALKEWNEAKPNVDAGTEDYGWVDIATVRKNGIFPLPVH